MESGGNNFDYFPENQLTKLSARPLRPLVAISPHPQLTLMLLPVMPSRPE